MPRVTMEYEIVKYSPELRIHVAKLRKHLDSPDAALNAAYLEWKYDRNPYMDTPLIYLAFCEGKVVGMRGMYGAKWQVGDPGQTFIGPCGGDLVIAPDHRNRGVATRIMEVALNDLGTKGYTYVFSLSAGLTTYLGSLMMGWRSVGPVQTACRRSRGKIVSSPIRKYAHRLPFLPPAKNRHPFDSLDKNGALRQGEGGTNVAIEQTPRPEAMAELVERIGNDGRMRHVRDRQYFAWRFQNPLSVYRFLFWEGARLEGYLVLRTSVYPHRLAEGVSIADWEATNPQVRADLLHAAIQWGDFDELTIWSATLPVEAKTVLRSTGFEFLEEAKSMGRSYRAGTNRSTVLVRPVRENMLKATDWVLADRRLLSLGDWDLRMIYSDSF